MLSSFFDVIKHPEGQQEIEEYIEERLRLILEKEKEEAATKNRTFEDPSGDVLRKLAASLFWNANFFVIFGILEKTMSALGSDKLVDVANAVCDKNDNPAHQLIKQGILMQYDKNLQVDNITKLINQKDYSETARKLFRFLVVRYCSTHQITYKDRQRIEHCFGIKSAKLLSMSPGKPTR